MNRPASGAGNAPSRPDAQARRQLSRQLRRRSALIATALTVPLVVILAFALAPQSKHSGSATTLPAVQIAAPTVTGSAAAACNQVLAALPTTLAGLAPRLVHAQPTSPYVLAWGNPAVILRCGVSRPAAFTSSSELTLVGQGNDNVNWQQYTDGTDSVFVSVDRAVYVEVRIPQKQDVQPLPIIGAVLAKTLPAVCQVSGNNDSTVIPDNELCTHRS